MTGSELKEIRDRLSVGSVAFSKMLGASYDSAVKAWLGGRRPIPENVARLARLLVWLESRGLLSDALQEISDGENFESL